MDADSEFPVELLHDSHRSVVPMDIDSFRDYITTGPNMISVVLTAQERVSAAEIRRPHIYRSRAESHL
ncbi:hypothetical protein C443_12181 [Haloarcula argentinensis DSM 12282]|uniref:Uncharacterized protein n=1 Tax=Haloarcula argentinensis TaxID=43776 RepID=A0A830FDI1_HALAR|nr:hypothetical protein C443_12181 [Haloarcula argentinensis DSM 12282]GGM36323.1 hypothetical protein GCM10009006_16900 [Haloarcula argentinensis]